MPAASSTPSAAAPESAEVGLLASELRVVVGQLIRRLRAEQGRFSISQGAVLGRLDREGPQSVSDLAAAERVRPQSMAQTVADLESAGLLDRRPDPDDRRRALVSLTEAGVETLLTSRREREGWLAGELAKLSAADRRTLVRAVALIDEIAAAPQAR